MSAQPHSIFISYRRADSIYAVDQLDQRLKLAFGEEAVFRDASSIAPSAAFPDDIRRALDEARVALVIIGPLWLRTTTKPSDSHSARRLDDAADWVAIEVETLLQRGDGVSVIPVLLGVASMPKPDDLPSGLKALTSRNGMKLSPFPDFTSSIIKIIEAVGKLLGVAPQPVAPPRALIEKTPRFGGRSFIVTGKQFVGREQELLLLDEVWDRAQKEDAQKEGKINVLSLTGQGGEGKSALVLQWKARRARHGWQGARRVFEWSFHDQGSNTQSSAGADEFFNAAFAWFDKTAEVPRDPFTKGAKLGELVAAEPTLLLLDGLEPLQQPPGGFGGELKDPAMRTLLRGLAGHNPGLCILTSRTNITDLSDFEHRDGSCLRHPLDSLDPTTARALLRELGVLGPDQELDEAAECFHRHAYDLNLLGNYVAQCTADRDIRGWRQRFPILREDERIHPEPDAAGKRAGHGRRILRAYERWLGPDSPALAVLRLLGLFDQPVHSDLLDELRAAPVIPGLTEAVVSLPQDDWLLALKQLQELALVHSQPLFVPAGRAEVREVSVSAAEIPDETLDALVPVSGRPEDVRAKLKQLIAIAMATPKNLSAKPAERPRHEVTYTLDTHPLLREHFAAELREHHEDAFTEGHRRLYAYLCATTPDQPDATLEDLQPLYQAVTHGCQAGLQQEAWDEVWIDRIRRRNKRYSTTQLGAFDSNLRAAACFFEQPWNRVSPALAEDSQPLLFDEAGFALRNLGRLAEALDPLRIGLEMRINRMLWKGAALIASDVSELELMLGDVTGAVRDAEHSATYADRSAVAFPRCVSRCAHANALHQAGRRAEAEWRFCEAEQVQCEAQPTLPLLYSTAGFHYCDLLLMEAERQAGKAEGRMKGEELVAQCRAVSERAARTLGWAIVGQPGCLTIALDHLTLGRAELYAAILKSRDRRAELALSFPPATPEEGQGGLSSAATELAHAVCGLRRSGVQEYLPRGLLTRAWLRSLIGRATGPDSARSDLDEAWEIAERGPMPLFLADIHLYRARLFHHANPYPWQSPQQDLAEARRLIFKHGYLRRKEELEDAQAALVVTPIPDHR